MPDFDLSIDIYVLALLLLVAALAGFMLRSRQLAKKQRQILRLEQEVMQANAESLEAQREYCELESKVKEGDSPVIPMIQKQDGGAGAGKSENF